MYSDRKININYGFTDVITHLRIDKPTNPAKMSRDSHWSMGLLATMKDPDARVMEDETIVVIKDKYPKARFHYLVLPKKQIPSVASITKEDEGLLEHMESIGKKLADKQSDYEFM